MVNNLVKRHNIYLLPLFIFLNTFCFLAWAQDTSHLLVIKKYKEYKKGVKADSLKKMVEVKTIIPDIRYDLRYATTNNFLKQKLYHTEGDITFLRLPVARALAKVQQELDAKGFSLKIWDAYRPYRVTVKMWEPIKDERYVADPKKGSGHNRGAAIDLTIVNKATGQELNMGTGFDNFSDSAHQTFTHLPEEILQNRQLLKSTMEKFGFVTLPSEWWHFYWNKINDFEVMDIDFKKFKKN